MWPTSFSLVAVVFGLNSMTVDGSCPFAVPRPNETTTFSDIIGPYLAGHSFTWSQYITPTTVGTVEVIINTDTNRTYTTTKTNTEFSTNGTISILTRTDTNAVGTVTAVAHDLFGYNVTVAYPTPIFDLGPTLTWNAILPTVVNKTTCCFAQDTYSPTPTHTPFASPTGTTDSADPSGWLYKLNGFDYGDPDIELDSANITSLWGGQSIGISYTGCNYALCDTTNACVKAASVAVSQAYLFATSTFFTSGSGSSSAAGLSAPSQLMVPHTTVKVDPIAASPTRSSVEIDSVTASLTPTSPPAAVSTQPSVEVESGTASPITPSVTASPEAEGTPAVSTSSSVVPDATSSPLTVSTEPLGSTIPQPSTTTGNLAVLIASVIGLMKTASPSANAAVGGSTTMVSTSQTKSLLSATSLSQAPAAISIGHATISVDASSQLLVSGQMLIPGSPITIGDGSSNTVVVLSTSASETVLQVGTSVSTINGPGIVVPTNSAIPIVVGGSTIIPKASSHYIISGQTLVPGSSVTVGSGSSTIVIALSTKLSETILQIGLSASTIHAVPITPTTNSVQAIVVQGSTITPDTSSLYVVSGQTLTPGSIITIGSGPSATIVALQTSGSRTIVVVGSSTSTLPQQKTTQTTTSTSRVTGTVTVSPSSVFPSSVSPSSVSPSSVSPSSVSPSSVSPSSVPSSTTVSSGSSFQQSSSGGGSSSTTASSSAQTSSATNIASRQHQDSWDQLGLLLTICLTILLNAL